MLYDGSVITKETNVISIADSEETLMLEEESQSKMLLKQSDPMVLEKKVNTKPINYAELNRLSEDFSKRFVPQQELSDEQAFWLQTSHPNTDQSASSPVKIKAQWELPKVSLVNTSLKKFKYHHGQFDNVVKKQITSDVLTEGEWGRVPYDQRNNPPQHPRIVFPPILNINYFRHFLDILRNYDPMDDEPMWAVNRVVALTLGSAITILETANEFAIKGSSNTDTDKIMARMDAMTIKMDAEYKELQS
ncbi:hypothetical protein Tco_0655226 [Tanacetum coccineum]|uniref:Uncharacterized protein n=1 Tax=Tanacetum coccineum TaxID=301880 RepID=A0ABQ4X5R0_9ASTR